MTGLRSIVRAILAGHYRARARRILARVDGMLDRASGLKKRAAKLEAAVVDERDGHLPRDGP